MFNKSEDASPTLELSTSSLSTPQVDQLLPILELMGGLKRELGESLQPAKQRARVAAGPRWRFSRKSEGSGGS